MSFNFSRISRGNCTTKTKSVRKLLNSPLRPRDERFGFRRFLDHLAKKKVKLAKLQTHTHFGNHRRNAPFPTWPTGRPHARDVRNATRQWRWSSRGAYLDETKNLKSTQTKAQTLNQKSYGKSGEVRHDFGEKRGNSTRTHIRLKEKL